MNVKVERTNSHTACLFLIEVKLGNFTSFLQNEAWLLMHTLNQIYK